MRSTNSFENLFKFNSIWFFGEYFEPSITQYFFYLLFFPWNFCVSENQKIDLEIG